jgi:aromatic ring-opening dioxygenase LigB subunit
VLLTAAVCPHPPLLVPEVASGAAPELDDLRAACDEAVRRLTDAGPELLVVVGGDRHTRDYGSDAAGGLRPYGLDLTIGTGEPVLPLSLTIGRWLLTRGNDPGRTRFQGVAADAPAQECLRLGRRLAESAGRVGLLVMGDGTACRTQKAPGYLDARAEPYDIAVARALADADTSALARLDPRTSRELRVAGRAAWQVLAGAAGAGRFTTDLLAAEAPYGIGYVVASWRAC